MMGAMAASSGVSAHVQLHVLRATPEAAAEGEPLLSDDERARAARFATPILRARYTAFRGGLRRLLAAQLSADPARLRFVYGPQGRP